jgi:SAM-dependent methyltransferase
VEEVVFDERVAATYDASSPYMFDPAVLDPAVDLLAELAAGGAALELGIGTGRVALPLSRRGVRVHGIDISEPMVARLRAKPGGDAIGITIGDFATTSVGERFRLVYVVYNAITNLTTQDAQVECFRNAAAHLEPGGHFVAEVFVPELQRLPRGDTHRAFRVTPTHLGFDEYDVVAQRCTSHHYFTTGERFEHFSSVHRYAWPAELDLMARMAGLTRCERWADWARAPFTATSTDHVSVWRKVE